MKLTDITFPVYCIKNYDTIITDEKIIYVEEDEYRKILDNKYLEGDTLGKRRLRIPKESRYNLKFCYIDFHQLLKSKCKLFIDNNGILINYKKHYRAKLTYHRIEKSKQVENVGHIIFLEDLNIPLEVSSLVYNYQNYVGLLHYGNGYVVYEFCHTKKSNTWRMV
jgi:hypothetical protein